MKGHGLDEIIRNLQIHLPKQLESCRIDPLRITTQSISNGLEIFYAYNKEKPFFQQKISATPNNK